jgi:thioesterase domain-containing protein
MEEALIELELTLKREMPITAAMDLRPLAWEDGRLSMTMPLLANRNHQDSAFAGSLNALCTIVGWGTVFMLLRREGLAGNIVIRRSEIRYLRPVHSEEIVARGLPLDPEAESYFFELLRSKGRSKIDVAAEIADAAGRLVSFHGAYVVQD